MLEASQSCGRLQTPSLANTPNLVEFGMFEKIRKLPANKKPRESLVALAWDLSNGVRLALMISPQETWEMLDKESTPLIQMSELKGIFGNSQSATIRAVPKNLLMYFCGFCKIL